jgi:AcrR family transcriptional regulator
VNGAFSKDTEQPVLKLCNLPLMSSTTASRQGRPRSERARLAVLDAAADLLAEGGLAAATIEAVAARAGVSKVTIYRWWPNRGALAVDAYFWRYRDTIAFARTGDTATDLTTQLRNLIGVFRGRAGTLMAELLGQAQTDPMLSEQIRELWLKPRRKLSREILLDAVNRGEIRADVDPETILDLLFAPVYFRLAVGHAPLDDALADRLVRSVLDGVATA